MNSTIISKFRFRIYSNDKLHDFFDFMKQCDPDSSFKFIEEHKSEFLGQAPFFNNHSMQQESGSLFHHSIIEEIFDYWSKNINGFVRIGLVGVPYSHENQEKLKEIAMLSKVMFWKHECGTETKTGNLQNRSWDQVIQSGMSFFSFNIYSSFKHHHFCERALELKKLCELMFKEYSIQWITYREQIYIDYKIDISSSLDTNQWLEKIADYCMDVSEQTDPIVLQNKKALLSSFQIYSDDSFDPTPWPSELVYVKFKYSVEVRNKVEWDLFCRHVLCQVQPMLPRHSEYLKKGELGEYPDMKVFFESELYLFQIHKGLDKLDKDLNHMMNPFKRNKYISPNCLIVPDILHLKQTLNPVEGDLMNF